ncbi:YrhB domain-containing protein [Streptomyces sp. GC420]|uniref:YrhB domain-containing protein n=1 Tax=Streptomyces sp. GC420 TaxID=2697568 RepID=UPI0014152F28|nr:YrhB domain-containing protein [Streptomyces sp. GC420]NBM20497.1 serine protease [Streptomyces sp. GC420]
MLSKHEAVEAARAFLHKTFADRPWTIVMLPDESYEHPAAWGVRFDTQEAIDSGDDFAGPIIKVLIVPKDGSAPHFPPSHLPVADYLDLVSRGEWPPKRA